ncbi:Peptidyl-prolyl cis-trans isomerase pin4 [Coemansia sp. S3946]|nr:Peptidyl-prolyl cis-trans isomerase pin4 [Coemansia sp. S3946]
MSKAIEETLRKLERAHISEPSAPSASPPASSTSTSTASAVASPAQGHDTLAHAPKDLSDSVSAALAAAPQSSDPTSADSDAAAKARSRRTVQSMYGAPPGYNASMGVGGARDSLGSGRVASGRQRNSIMVPAAMHPQNIVPTTPLQLPMTRLTGAEYALMANMPDDAIPNAIVVKNINFIIKREELLQTMADLGLPLPYAFNYHFDGGVFRGLAFGNFRAPEEAARAIVGLNGISLLGRPLKVEYKKALPGTAPPPHPNTIAMMTSSAGAINGLQSVSDVHTDINYSASHASGGYQQQQQFDQPIPRQRRNPSGTGAERPRSMMVFPSAMPVPEQSQSQSQNQGQPSGQMQQKQQQQQHHHSTSDDPSTMIDLDDKDTRLLYDLVSQFRHDKAMAELEFPSTLNTKQRQSVMLIAERFGLNHETKGDAQGRYIRVYKGLETLLESTEVRRRSVASPNPATLAGNNSQQTPRYGSVGRSRPASMLYPDTMSMNGMASPPPQRMNSYQQQQQPSHGFAQDPTRVRSYTTNYSQGSAHFSSQQFQQPPQQQQQQQSQQMPQPFPRSSDNPGRASGNYVGYPSRLYQDSVVVPSRQPHGPEMTQNFAARQQMHQQEERQVQRQMQLKVLQQNRQRRLSSTAEDGAPATASPTASESSPSSAPAFRIEKPGSKAIPIVKPTNTNGDSASSSSGTRDSSPASLALAMGERSA